MKIKYKLMKEMTITNLEEEDCQFRFDPSQSEGGSLEILYRDRA